MQNFGTISPKSCQLGLKTQGYGVGISISSLTVIDDTIYK